MSLREHFVEGYKMNYTNKSLSLLCVTILGFSSSAIAADHDLPTEHLSWTGWYAGVAAGAGGAVGDLNIGGGFASLDGISAEGFLGSAFIGYDYQIKPKIVIGIMADYTISNIESELSIPVLAGFNATFRGDRNWSILGRAGYLVGPDTLAYVLAGYTKQEFELNTNIGFGLDFDAGGLTVGSGIEHRINQNWSARAEYRYTSFGDFTPIPGLLDVAVDAHTARFGLAYRMSSENGMRPDFDAPEVNWTGLNVGLGLGANSTSAEISSPGVFSFDGIGAEGLQAGVHIGYDHQINDRWVVGIEAAARHSNAKLDLKVGGVSVADVEEDYNLSLTGRIGWLPAPNAMIYALAGRTWAEYDFSAAGGAISANFNHNGWTVGSGVEYAVNDKWTSRLEYRFTQFDDETLFGPIESTPSDHSFMTSVSYRFDLMR